MLQPLKAKYNRGISNITETMILVFKYWPCKKKKIKLGKEPTILKTKKMKHHMISHQATDFKGDFLQGLKATHPLYPYWPFGSHLQFSCPRLTTWGSLSGELVGLNNVLVNLEAKRLDLKQRYKFTSARPITNLFNCYHVFVRSQPVEIEPRIKNVSFFHSNLESSLQPRALPSSSEDKAVSPHSSFTSLRIFK